MLFVAPSCWNKQGHRGFGAIAPLYLLILSYTVYGHIFASVFLRWGDRCYIQRPCPRNEGHGSSSSSTSPHPSSSPVTSTGRTWLLLLHIFLSIPLQIRAGPHIFQEGHTDFDKVCIGPQFGPFIPTNWDVLNHWLTFAVWAQYASHSVRHKSSFMLLWDQMKILHRPMCDVDCSYTMIYLTFSLRWLSMAQPTLCLLNLCPWWPFCSYCSHHGNTVDHEATIPESDRDKKNWETTS